MATPGTNSDIIANAFEGNGGNINITADGISGFDVRNTNNPRQDPRNNLTASSRFGTSGTVNTPNVDPSQGLSTLPANLVDPSSLIDRRCSITSNASKSKFTIAGRGGIPGSPHAQISSRTVTLDLRTSPSEADALGAGFSRAASAPEPNPATVLASAPETALVPCGS